MKLLSLLSISAATILPSNAWIFQSGTSSTRTRTVLSMASSQNIYYSSSTGNTETVAGYIAKASGLECVDIGDATKDEILSYDGLIVGAPTWHTGSDEQRSGTSWDDWLYDTLPSLDLTGKKVAIFGCGDQESYNDYYCDAAGELYDKFLEKGCTIYGFTSTDGYYHQASKAEVDGKFVGLMTDEDNQFDLSEERAKTWVAQLKEEGFFN